ncbi:hypothetical protein [Mesorhizobium sp. Root552]|uniref:hypothetical protein n=1 Tax=Mesorhizobium sp. Root552 TaxID=1736555 RepID=UPI000A3EAA26|nr:hypothetical protein [Mesorhizobium sp. Root552]
MGKRPSKSETLTIRLDPKTRFMLDFVARLRGQSITTVVERAISDAANRANISTELDYAGNTREIRTWRDFWSVYEGERALKIAQESELHPTFEEERRLAFAKQFDDFFFTKSGDIRTGYVEVLWPRIDEFVEIYEQTKTSNYFAAGEAMKAALTSARVAAPDWPKKVPAKSRDLDDEIPF